MRMLAGTIIAFLLMGGSALAVEFEGRRVKLNGRVLNEGSQAEGLMMNARMIQAAIEDYGNYKDKMKYPDGPWSAERNVNEFIDALPIYASHGLNMVTVGMQGGHPRFKCGDSGGSGKRNFSMFTGNGALRADAMSRLERLIRAADDVDIIVTVQYFYQNQDNKLDNNAAVLRATEEATAFLKSIGTGNILVEIANEVTTRNYKHTALQPGGIPDRIDQVHDMWPAALVTASMNTGGRLGTTATRKAVDWVSFHANGETADSIVKIINRAKDDPDLKSKPIAVTEDPWHDQGSKPMMNAIGAGAGWGFYEQGCEYAGSYTGQARYRDGFQSPPINWRISNNSKREFFDQLQEVTS